jgi:hypothetical protein
MARCVDWLAGLLEGEGCFSRQRGATGTCTPLVSVAMTDLDVIEEVRRLMQEIGGRDMKIRRRALPSGKTAYGLSVTGLPAVKIMLTVLPLMGTRRSRDISRITSEWNPKVYRQAVAFRSEMLGQMKALL